MARKKERYPTHPRKYVGMRRRRLSKTDYKHRRNMIRQDCHKYGAVKSRLVVRRTNTKVIVAIVQAFMSGDRIVTYADSTELKKYGVDFGLTNYFACYATGLLCARRALEQLGGEMSKIYEPMRDAGVYKLTEDKEGERRAYKVFLDIGLARSSRGGRVFAAMKGTSDGGLQIPHSESKFYGYSEEDGLDSAKLRERIFSKPTVDYMIQLKDSDPEKYKKQFGGYIAKGIKPEDIESMQSKCLDAIIERPGKAPKAKAPRTEHYPCKVPKLTAEQRRARAKAKLATAMVE